MEYIGDFKAGTTVNVWFTTSDGSGGAIAFSATIEVADFDIYKGVSETQRTSTAGWTLVESVDSIVGLHNISIDTSDNTHAGFFAAGNDYTVVLTPDETVDSQTVAAVLCQFSIENRTNVKVVSDIALISTKLDSDMVLVIADHDKTQSDIVLISGKLDSDMVLVIADHDKTQSDIVLLSGKADSDQVISLADIAALATKADSDQVILISDHTKITSDQVVNQTILVSDHTKITSDQVVDVDVVTTKLDSDQVVSLSDLAIIYSDTTIIYSDTTVIEAGGGSLTAAQASDLVAIESELNKVYSDTTIIYSDTTIIYSDTTAIEAGGGSLTAAQASDLVAIESELNKVYSDTTVLESDSIIIESNTIVIESDTIVISSDTAVIEARQVIFSGTATGSSTTTKVFVQSGDPPSGGADDDYNDTLILVWRGTDKSTARLNVRAVTDYDDSDPSFILDSALGFTPLANDLVEVYAADSAALASLAKLTTGFGTTVPDTLEGYLRAMMSKAASTPANAGTYSAATDSLEFLGEKSELITGSGFATGTDSLKQIRDAIDNLIAPAVVGASALSGSGFLSDCVTLVRQMTDEPSLLPKYTDADVVELVTSAMTVVMSEVHNNSDHNIINRFDIQLVPGQLSYIMPPNVGEVWAVRKMSLTTPIIPIYEVWTDNHWSSHQSGFVIEYNEFRLLTDWRSSDVLEMLYVPNGESFMHKATATSVGANTIIFPASVTDGTLDTRANAYAGYLVRILSDTTGYVQEKVIDTYDHVTRKATLTTDWNPLPTGTIVYEVLPTFSNIIKHCVCLQAAMDVLSNEGREKRLKTITGRYLVKIRALRQMITKKSSRFPSHGIGDTSDNDRRGDYYGWLV